MSERTSKDYQLIIRRYLKSSKGAITQEAVRRYLGSYLNKAAKTYNNQLDALRAFIERYLKQKQIIQNFKKAYQPYYEPQLPTRKQVKDGFNSLFS